MSTPNNPGGYDWGAPAPQPEPAGSTAYNAQPTTQSTTQTWSQTSQQPEPQRQPSESARLPNPVKILLAILAVTALLLSGLFIFQKVRSTPLGPLGWDEATLESKLDGGKITNCDLSQDFYDSVGVTDVRVEEGYCTGVAKTADGKDIRVTLYTENGPEGEATSPNDPELIGWKQTKDPAEGIPDSLDDLPNSDGSGYRCQMYSSQPMLKGTWMSASAPCEVLYPMARQLHNLQEQYDFSRKDHGLFDFSRPNYLDVEPVTPTVQADLFKEAVDAAVPLGEGMPVDSVYHDGSMMAVDGGSVEDAEDGDGKRVCITTSFTLGERSQSYVPYFETPDAYVAIFPSGQRVELLEEYGRISLHPGDTRSDLHYCSNFTPGITSDSFVAYIADEEGWMTWVVGDAPAPAPAGEGEGEDEGDAEGTEDV